MNNQRVFHPFLTIIGLMMLFSNNAKGQTMTDRIFKRDGIVLFATFLYERGDSIMYQNFEDKSKVVYSLAMSDVDKVILKNNHVMSYKMAYRMIKPEVVAGKDSWSTIEMKKGEKAMTDRIVKKDNTVLFVTVLGEQTDSIAYQLFEQKEASVFYVPKTEVDQLVLKNGRTFTYVRNYKGPTQADVIERTEVPFGTKRHVIKVTPFAFYLGYTNFVLERKTKPRQSVELKLGLVGLGRPQSSIQERGAYTSIGYKWMANRIENMSRPPRHSLQGSYLRPELLIGRYHHPFSHETYRGNDVVTVKDQLNITYGCLLLNVGKQWVLSLLTLDVFATVGYGAYQQSDNGIGIVRGTRYGNRLEMTGKNGSGLTEFKVGLYVGSLF